MHSTQCEILHNQRLAEGYFRIGLKWKTPEIKAGHFVMIKVSDGLDPLLRRPFGIYSVIGAKGKVLKGTGVELIYRVVGRGTELLSLKKPGEKVALLGPLGNGFPEAEEGKRPILVAGGMGIVPLYLLAGKLKGATLLFGAKSRKETLLLKEFRELDLRIKIATEDGSAGRKGLVTELLEEDLRPGSAVYACGPTGMLKAAARVCHAAGARCLVSLERSMACGIGVCLGCAVRTGTHNEKENRNYSMVCSDGPVFDSEEIDWELL